MVYRVGFIAQRQTADRRRRLLAHIADSELLTEQQLGDLNESQTRLSPTLLSCEFWFVPLITGFGLSHCKDQRRIATDAPALARLGEIYDAGVERRYIVIIVV
jgi:hypothetical protein